MSEGLNTASLVSRARSLADYNGAGANDSIREALREVSDALESTSRALSEKEGLINALDQERDGFAQLAAKFQDELVGERWHADEAARQRDVAVAARDEALESASRALSEKEGLIDRLRMEAQIHAGEARCHKATVHEAYQACSGATGEPGNWHGVEPIRKALSEATRQRDKALAALSAVSAAIGTVRFMDPPDGGDVSLAEQVRRMSAALRASEEREVQKLVWDETFVDRGDGAQDHSGWEAPNGFGLYYTIEMYFGSDSYGWQVVYDGRVISDHDDPEAAKASAQRHFEGMVRAALVGTLADATQKDPGTEQREAGL